MDGWRNYPDYYPSHSFLYFGFGKLNGGANFRKKIIKNKSGENRWLPSEF